MSEGRDSEVADAVDPDEDFARLKAAELSLVVILAEAKASPSGMTLVGAPQIRMIIDNLSQGMLGYAWLRDEVIGEEKGDSLMEKLQSGLSDDEKELITQLLDPKALRAD